MRWRGASQPAREVGDQAGQSMASASGSSPVVGTGPSEGQRWLCKLSGGCEIGPQRSPGPRRGPSPQRHRGDRPQREKTCGTDLNGTFGLEPHVAGALWTGQNPHRRLAAPQGHVGGSLASLELPHWGRFISSITMATTEGCMVFVRSPHLQASKVGTFIVCCCYDMFTQIWWLKTHP